MKKKPETETVRVRCDYMEEVRRIAVKDKRSVMAVLELAVEQYLGK